MNNNDQLAMSDWSLAYDEYKPELEGLREALCTLGNGYFATRGAAADSCADEVHYPGTYLAGGYNRLSSEVGGRKVENEDLVNLPNWLPLSYRIDDGEWFRLDETQILSYHQELDVHAGVLRRVLRTRDAAGRTTRWRERRIVSMADAHLAGLCVELTAEDWSGRMTVRTAIDGGVINHGVPRYRELASRHLEVIELEHLGADTIFLRCQTSQSLLQVAMAARTRIYVDGDELKGERHTECRATEICQEIGVEMRPGSTIVVEKILALHCSRDRAISEPGLEARRSLGHAGRFDELLAAHVLAWQHVWEDCDIDIEGAEASIAPKLRVNIFHLLQTTSMHSTELDIGVPARGWHGEAYRGHIFWDELFIFPFLSLRLPTLTRSLLLYRYRRLPEARRAAREAGFEGAMYPWQSGSNGREETQRLHLNPKSGRWNPDNTHRQRHINSAIAYNIWQYYQVSDDREFLISYGAEMMFEIARFWASVATYKPEIDRYEINGVMGPDEYHTDCRRNKAQGETQEEEGGVDNNAYTNLLAAWVLTRACDLFDLLPKTHCRHLCERIGLRAEETERWRDVGSKLRVPFHDDGIISQFEGYGDLEEFDWKGYEKKYGDIQRLDRILEAEGDSPNRYKISKQADVLMLFYLFSAEDLALLFEQLGYRFDRDTIPKNIDYYISRTSHGSTLSGVAHSWVVARSNRPRSWRLFQRALDSDIADVQGGTTPEGIHVGAMAGSIDLVQRCYLGIEMRANVLHFDPALPADLTRVKVRLRYRRQVLDVDANHELLKITCGASTSSPITIAYRGHYRDVGPGATHQFRLLKPEAHDRDENRSKPAAAIAPTR